MAEPILLDEVVRRGAVIFGSVVARVTVLTEDGRRLSLDLPSGAKMTALQTRILDQLAESSVPMNRKQVATKIGQKNITGRFGQSVAGLLSAGIIFESDGNLTDDATKFAATP